MPAEFRADYGPVSESFHAVPGSLEAWLTERYALYTADAKGNVYIGNIHHPPWSLQVAQADIQINRMTGFLEIQLPDTPDHLLYAAHQRMLTWPLKGMS